MRPLKQPQSAQEHLATSYFWKQCGQYGGRSGVLSRITPATLSTAPGLKPHAGTAARLSSTVAKEAPLLLEAMRASGDMPLLAELQGSPGEPGETSRSSPPAKSMLAQKHIL